jgi:hypothetical protein
LVSRGKHLELKDRSFIDLRLDKAHRTIILSTKPLTYEQAKAYPAAVIFGVPNRREFAEHLEKFALVFLRDANPGVGHFHIELLALWIVVDNNSNGTFEGKLSSICEKIQGHLG